MVFQTIPPDCLDFAFNVHTYDKIWSSDAFEQQEARRAAAIQEARAESLRDQTIPQIVFFFSTKMTHGTIGL